MAMREMAPSEADCAAAALPCPSSPASCTSGSALNVPPLWQVSVSAVEDAPLRLAPDCSSSVHVAPGR